MMRTTTLRLMRQAEGRHLHALSQSRLSLSSSSTIARSSVNSPFTRQTNHPHPIRSFSHATPLFSASLPSSPSSSSADGKNEVDPTEPKLSLTFTCAVPECGHRSTHSFTKRSYERGIVLVQCPGCKNRHLIADHLGWFAQSNDEPRTVEQMIEAKGGRVQKGIQYVDGKEYETVEILSDQHYPGRKEE